MARTKAATKSQEHKRHQERKRREALEYNSRDAFIAFAHNVEEARIGAAVEVMLDAILKAAMPGRQSSRQFGEMRTKARRAMLRRFRIEAAK
jgi:hypothetical protein